MTVIVVIPARYASTRYPGKPLVELRGAGGEAKSLIRRSWDAAMSVSAWIAWSWPPTMTGSRTTQRPLAQRS